MDVVLVAVAMLRVDVRVAIVLRSFRVGVGDPSLACGIVGPGVVVVRTGLAHSGPLNPPPVLIDVTFRLIVLRMLVSFLGLATRDGRFDVAVRAETEACGIKGAFAVDGTADDFDVKSDLLAGPDTLAKDALEVDVLAAGLAEDFGNGADVPLDFPFPVSMMNGTSTFDGGGLMFS